MMSQKSCDLAKMSKEEHKSTLETHEQRMKERNIDKEKEDFTLQARFNEKEKKANGKCPMSRGIGNFHNFGGRQFLISNNSIFQKGKNNGNMVVGSSNYIGDNVRGI